MTSEEKLFLFGRATVKRQRSLCPVSSLTLCSSYLYFPARRNPGCFTSYQLPAATHGEQPWPCKGLCCPPQAIIGGQAIRLAVHKTHPSITPRLGVHVRSLRHGKSVSDDLKRKKWTILESINVFLLGNCVLFLCLN